MRSLHAKIEVFCPRSAVVAWTHRYLTERHGIVSLGIPLRAFGWPTFVHIYRNVEVEFAVVPDTSTFARRHDHALRVVWKPTHGGPFPALEGLVTASAHRTHATLHFDGVYWPPFGIAGEFFDALLGRHIARIAVTTLLQDIRRFVESQDLSERHSLAFASFEANRREAGSHVAAPIPLHGSAAIRRDGEYLACAITLEGHAPDFPALISAEYALEPEQVRRLLGELAAGHAPATAIAGAQTQLPAPAAGP